MTIEWTWVDALDWIVRLSLLGAAAYALFIIRREQARATRLADLILCRRLAELLPLPHLGDRGTLLAMLRSIAPGHSLAVYTAGEPPLLIARRLHYMPPGAEAALWIEVHRDALLSGQVVREALCGTIVPLRLRNGLLTGAIVIDTREELTLDPAAQATLRHVAGLARWTPALEPSVETEPVQG
jgi:hypothetical protein